MLRSLSLTIGIRTIEVVCHRLASCIRKKARWRPQRKYLTWSKEPTPTIEKLRLLRLTKMSRGKLKLLKVPKVEPERSQAAADVKTC